MEDTLWVIRQRGRPSLDRRETSEVLLLLFLGTGEAPLQSASSYQHPTHPPARPNRYEVEMQMQLFETVMHSDHGDALYALSPGPGLGTAATEVCCRCVEGLTCAPALARSL